MRKYSLTYSDELYNFLVINAKEYTIKELVILIKEKFDIEFDKKKLAQYCIKMHIKYKYEKPKKSHSNIPTANGTIVNKTDGDYLKIKVGPHKWEYLQRKIYEGHYGIKLPDDVYVIFLDQDRRNFNIDNLKAIPMRVSAIMSKDGLFFENVKFTKLGCLCSKLKIKNKNILKNIVK